MTLNTRLAHVIIAAAIALPAYATAQSKGLDGLAALTARLEHAALNDDAEGVKDARAEAMRMLAAAPKSEQAPLLRYTVAYAGWRLAYSAKLTAAEQTAMLADAESQLIQSITANGSFADAHGLLASVYGALMSRNPDLGQTLGASAGETMGRAMSLGRNNPRIAVLRGVSRLNTPPEYGGDAAEAEAQLRRALQLFEKEPPSRPWPNWGRYDAHVWLGQALARRGDVDGARAEYKAALAIAPANGKAKGLLERLK